MLYFASAGFLLSSAFISGLVPNLFLWAAAQTLAAGLMIRMIWKCNWIVIPSFSSSVSLGLLTLWSFLSLFWTGNFYSTLASLYKIAFLMMLLALFINDRERWEKPLKASAIGAGTFCAVLWIFFPAAARAWIPTPSLSGGFMAMSSLLSPATSIYLVIGVAVFLASSLGAVLAWTGGSLIQSSLLHRKKILAGAGILFLVSIVPHPQNPVYHLWRRKWTDRYTLERIEIWKDSAKIFLARPSTGHGLGSFRDVYPEYKKIPALRNAPYAHNEILNILCELGWVGLGLLFFFMISFKRIGEEPLWASVGLAGLIQSLFDFNLRFLPVSVLGTFCISVFLEKGRCFALTKLRRGILLSVMLPIFIVFSLQAAASLLYGIDAKKHVQAALALDPMNSLYRSETGRMRDLEIAIWLEPRNVWFRRSAAQFYFQDWQKTGNPRSLESAKNEYSAILKLAPNVDEFKDEYKMFFPH